MQKKIEKENQSQLIAIVIFSIQFHSVCSIWLCVAARNRIDLTMAFQCAHSGNVVNSPSLISMRRWMDGRISIDFTLTVVSAQLKAYTCPLVAARMRKAQRTTRHLMWIWIHFFFCLLHGTILMIVNTQCSSGKHVVPIKAHPTRSRTNIVYHYEQNQKRRNKLLWFKIDIVARVFIFPCRCRLLENPMEWFHLRILFMIQNKGHPLDASTMIIW